MKAMSLPDPTRALAGRHDPMPVDNRHHVHGRPIKGEFPGLQRVMFGMGCFWGAERKFWSLPGVETTAVGYAAGYTPNASYREVCTGLTGHNEVVMVVFDPARISFDALLKLFWESHDPTQGMAQGNDQGTQYRSGIYVGDAALRARAEASRADYQQRLSAAGLGTISTEILDAPPFYYAENEHQQYLSKNPQGYCGLGGTGVQCAIGLDA